MLVVSLRSGLVTRATVAKLVPFKNAGLLEQAHRAIDRRDRNVGVNGCGARVERLYVGMVLAVTKHSRDDFALLGDAQPLVGAQLFNVDRSMHGVELVRQGDMVK